jgi:GNAT superfamily N-acetyltransferase
MERAWSVRTYEKGDENGIFELMKAVYSEEKYYREEWMQWWRWMYTENPVGVSRILVADHDGKIVGQYPLILVNMKIGEEIIKGSQNIDLMTHPDYQHQGIFFTLEKRALSEAGKEGINITYGFPNEPAYLGHLKSGWFDVCSLQVMIKPFNLENALKRRIKNKFMIKIYTTIGKLIINLFYRAKKPPKVDSLTITKISSFDDRIDDFWKKISNDHEIIIVRDKEYLNWRYVNIPNINYTIYLAEEGEEICGYVVLRCVKKQNLIFGYMFDIIASIDRPEVIHHLLSKAIQYFKDENADLIFCKMIADKTLRKIFRKNGFISSRFIKGGRFCAYTSHYKISETYLKNRKNWFIQIGDSDFI